jgi:hypothetical protein
VDRDINGARNIRQLFLDDFNGLSRHICFDRKTRKWPYKSLPPCKKTPALQQQHQTRGQGTSSQPSLVKRQIILNRLDNLHHIYHYFICGSPKINSLQDLFGAPLSSTREAKITQLGFSKPTLNGWK